MFKCEFSTSNAAFAVDSVTVFDFILRDIAERVAEGITGAFVRDTNGNKIGAWSRTDD